MAQINGSHYRPTYKDEHTLASYLVDVLEERLAGRDKPRRTNTQPNDCCLLGLLGPQKYVADVLDEAPEQPDPGVELSPPSSAPSSVVAPEAAASSGGATFSAAPQATIDPVAREIPEVSRSGRRPPSAMGFEVLLQPLAVQKIDISVGVSFCLFTRHLPTLVEQAGPDGLRENAPVAEVCQRWVVELPSVAFSIDPASSAVLQDAGVVQAAVDRVLTAAFVRADVARKWPKGGAPKLPNPAQLPNESAFSSFLQEECKGLEKQTSAIHACVEVRATKRSDGLIRIGVYLRNTTPETMPGTPGKSLQDSYLSIGDGRLEASVTGASIRPIEILPVPQDYQYDRRVWGVGHNTSVCVDQLAGSVKTRALARSEQPRIVTHDDPPALFSELAVDSIKVLQNIRGKMEDYLHDWQERVIGRNELELEPAAHAACKKDCDSFADEIRRFSAGIAALHVEPRLLTAFKGANRVFQRLAKGYDSWRLFQIVFIVTQLPALAIREGYEEGRLPSGETLNWKDCLDWGDVLWFRTGGGKTEAYLGLACCAMLYDRLRGKIFGVTAWLRLPLRMLSMQQLQRAMRVIWHTEVERQSLLGDAKGDSDPIRLGYFAGKSVTPNAIDDEVIRKYSTPEALAKLKVIPDCPACNAQGSVEVTLDVKLRRFKHSCKTCNATLPLDTSDEEVYRYLPALIVGTVDKMATVGQQPKFGMLWGGTHTRCPEHGYGRGEYCSVFGCKRGKGSKERPKVVPKDPSPSLHIQDELHLLQEDLGAFAGHYETLIRYCEAEIGLRPSKVIAATATIEGFEHQVTHLYGTKSARRFPGRGYDRYESFYAGPDRDDSGSIKTARIFVAFKSASMTPADASARVTEILQSEVSRLMQSPHIALAILKDAKTEDDVKALLRHYTTTLNYVGSLARGSRVFEALEDSKAKFSSPGDRELNVEYTSSLTSSAEVADVVHRIENPPDWKDPAFLDALVATSMISHGVDLERVNLMTMDGVPEETAAYIQASSRSGRRHVGLVVVVLADYSLRAASIYHRFVEYHAHLERMVSPVPVNRFAKYAVRRTLPGVVMGLLNGVYGARFPKAKFANRPEALAVIDATGGVFLEDLYAAYALGAGIYDEGLEKGLEEAIREGLEDIRSSLRSSHETTRDALRPPPMTSLRDVEIGVPFWPSPTGDRNLLSFAGRTRE